MIISNLVFSDVIYYYLSKSERMEQFAVFSKLDLLYQILSYEPICANSYFEL